MLEVPVSHTMEPDPLMRTRFLVGRNWRDEAESMAVSFLAD